MLFSFKRNNKKDTAKTDCLKGNLLQKFDEVNLRLQYKCAHWLESKTARLSRKSWIVILICFTLFTSGYSIYVIVKSFSQTTSSTISITPITKTTNAKTANEMVKINLSISKMEYERIIRFRRYMDSLGRSPTGKKTQDSIMQYRPGLLDSITVVENQYHSQFKN
jgi:predicted PurR-regulated permease PerM